jgi:hypothetical protein
MVGLLVSGHTDILSLQKRKCALPGHSITAAECSRHVPSETLITQCPEYYDPAPHEPGGA